MVNTRQGLIGFVLILKFWNSKGFILVQLFKDFKMQYIIFSDLDGTLLDHETYSFTKARPSLNLIRKLNIPLIICTSKTRAEIEYYRKKLGLVQPFIAEDGGAIYIPKDYFSFKFNYTKKSKEYYIIVLGTEYSKLLKVLNLLKKNYPVKAFHDMSIKEIMMDTGMPYSRARLARQREYDVVFKILDKKYERSVLKTIKKSGYNYVIGGRYYHIIGNNNKGKAVKILTKLLKKELGPVKTIGIGDSENDFAMLDYVDIPFLVMKKNRRYASKKYLKAGGVGPEGWNKAIKEVLGNA